MRISEKDFAIHAPRGIAAGSVDLAVHNRGPDAHELIVVRAPAGALPLRSDGTTVDEEGLDERHAIPGALEPGEPGGVRHLRVRLRPGRYVLICNMAGHYHGGMQPRPDRSADHARARNRLPSLRGPRPAHDRRDPHHLRALLRRQRRRCRSRATARSKHQATVLEVAARQRTLAERYVKEVLLAQRGAQTDPANTARPARPGARRRCSTAAPRRRSRATTTRPQLPAASDPQVRAQLQQEIRLVARPDRDRQRDPRTTGPSTPRSP